VFPTFGRFFSGLALGGIRQPVEHVVDGQQEWPTSVSGALTKASPTSARYARLPAVKRATVARAAAGSTRSASSPRARTAQIQTAPKLSAMPSMVRL
jgi:hypothetical protein